MCSCLPIFFMYSDSKSFWQVLLGAGGGGGTRGISLRSGPDLRIVGRFSTLIMNGFAKRHPVENHCKVLLLGMSGVENWSKQSPLCWSSQFSVIALLNCSLWTRPSVIDSSWGRCKECVWWHVRGYSPWGFGRVGWFGRYLSQLRD